MPSELANDENWSDQFPDDRYTNLFRAPVDPHMPSQSQQSFDPRQDDRDIVIPQSDAFDDQVYNRSMRYLGEEDQPASTEEAESISSFLSTLDKQCDTSLQSFAEALESRGWTLLDLLHVSEPELHECGLNQAGAATLKACVTAYFIGRDRKG